MVGDPVSDTITRLRNATRAGRSSVLIPYSKLRAEILAALLREGLILSYESRGKKVKRHLVAELDIKVPRRRALGSISSVSKPSRRIYRSAKDLGILSRRHSLALISTTKGLLSARDAVKENVGGEVLCMIR